VDLPLLDAAGFDAEGHRTLTAAWAPATSWVLDGHRTRAGDALLPGTGVLELAAEAMAAQGEPFPWSLRDLSFLRPLRTPDEGETAVRLRLRRTDEGYDLRIESAAPGAGFEANAEGAIDLLPAPPPAALDLAGIRARLDGRPTGLTRLPGGTLASPQEAHLRFGPRWRTLRDAALGDGEGLATLTLPPEGAEGTILHPGLLDLATGWAMALIPGYEPSRLWVPLAYGEVRVHAPLGPTVLSHVRLREGNAEAATLDVTLADPSGRVLLEARGFTMRRLDEGLAFAAPPPPAAEAPRALSPAEERLAQAVRQGIRAEEGAKAFGRALALGRPEVVVSSLPLPALIAQAERVEAPKAARAFAGPASADHVPPEGAAEERLAALFQDLLGAARVGAEDSFFDLGGHSLVAVRLFAQVRRLFGVDLPISALFEAPSVRALARLVAERGGALAGATPSGSASGSASGTASGAAPAAVPRPSRRFTHLVPMHGGEGGRGTPFFLVAGMFGNVLNLRHLAHLLGVGRAFYGLQARGLTGEEPPHASLVEAATSMIAEMRQVQHRGPWMVGGFSGGGITAFEIARQLREAGEEVAAVVLLDTPLPRRRPLTPRDRAAIQWQEIKAGGPAYPVRWAARRVAWELEKRRGRPVEAPAEPAFHDAAIEAAFYEAIATYEVHPWDGPLTLFRPPMRGKWEVAPGRWVSAERAYVLPDNDWTPFAPRLQVIEVPGDHDSMVLEPNVRVLAARLKRVLEAAERDRAAVRPVPRAKDAPTDVERVAAREAAE
jgi:thioesterase domain-containing protein/acyl carrier protein